MKPVYISARVTSVKRYSSLAWLRVEPGLKAAPGQFVMLWVPGLEAVPMSIAWSDETGVEFIVRRVGVTTERLWSSGRGDRLGMIGPLGRGLDEFSTLLEESGSVALVGGGSGVAPLLFASAWLRARGIEPEVYLGFRDAEEARIREVFELHGTSVNVACEHWGNVCDREGTVIDAYSGELRSARLVVAAGPLPMLKSLYRLRRGVRMIVVLEALVRCGVGFCGSCRLWEGGPLLCRDGPVFIAESVERLLRNDATRGD